MNRDLEELLRFVARHGEVAADDLVDRVSRPTGTYRDFYPLAALMHGDLLTTDTGFEHGADSGRGTFGVTPQDTASFLNQIAAPKGTKVTFHDMEHESVRGASISFFMTSAGYARLEQIDRDISEQRRKTRELVLTILVAVLAAIVGGWASTYFQILLA
jgi:hypothetical protein